MDSIDRVREACVAGFVAVVTLASVATAQAADRSCTRVERAAGNRALVLSEAEQNQAIDENSLWNLPEPNQAGNEHLLIQRDYVIAYDGDLRVPLWTAYRLDPARLVPMDRVNCFRTDERLPTGERSRLTDYREPIFDQGHLAPSADMEISINANVNSFLLSNMAPQYPGFNRGTWGSLEEVVRNWAKSDGDLYVISGSVFDRNNDGERDADADARRMVSNNRQHRVAVPTAFFKIISCRRDDGVVETISFLLPHDAQRRDGDVAFEYLADHIVPIREIEAVTGFRFVNRANVEEATEMWAAEGNLSRETGEPLCGR
ncbi:MAG: DNA/RNA non-specific endonuclease [Hyphomonadaceae bacterium]|nr:DNA/RNA non-specific endonuclease [Hyphomonadaceae bacterium]